MLPYSPVHCLLMESDDQFPRVLVITSGNITEEPIATTNGDARCKLSSVVDAFLMHDRDIVIGCDDSVIRIADGAGVRIRRSRGFAPFP